MSTEQKPWLGRTPYQVYIEALWSAPEGYVLVPIEPSDEMIRASLAVEWPAIYRDSLFVEGDGIVMRSVTDARIKTAVQQHKAVIAAAPTHEETNHG